VGGRAERLKQLDQAYDHVYWFLGLGGRALGLKMISMPNASALRSRSAISSSSVICVSQSCSGVGWIMTTPSFGLWYGARRDEASILSLDHFSTSSGCSPRTLYKA